MSKTISREALKDAAGTELGPSPWLTVDQERIQLFADATGDHQFIHVDPERAAQTPFGTTIAHGFLSLSLVPHLSEEIALAPEGLAMAVNYGLDKVRFLQPVAAGSEVRLRLKVLDVQEKRSKGLLVKQEATVEIRGQEKPALVAETLTLYVLRPAS